MADHFFVIKILILGALFVGLNNCSYIKEKQIPFNEADPIFDWFLYEGNDLVYDDLEVGEDEYLNPILAGFYPDPSIVRAGDDYYMVHSSFSYYPGIPIFHSKDLVNWNQIGHVLDRPSQLNLDSLGLSRGVFAPTIEYHEEEETFYVINTLVDGGGNFLVTAKDPSGPWSEPIWLPEIDGIDPSMFFDDDGKAYVLHNGPPEGEPLYEGHRALWIWEYDAEAQEIVGDGKLIVDGGVDLSEEPIWIEAPHLMKIEGEYLLSAAEGGTGPGHSQVVFKSDSPWGPYEPWDQNPILTQRHLEKDREFPVEYTGHADMVETQNGEWWAVFLGVRPYQSNFFNTGRETFMLPVRWKDGWPEILEGEETVPYAVKKPDLPEQGEPEVPHNGNFSVVDEFDGEELSDYWIFIRTPHEKWYELDEGSLRIQPRPAKLSSLGQPSFIGRRQQHAHASASAAMLYSPGKSGDEAGLTAFQGEEFYYFLKITLDDAGEKVIQLEKQAGEQTNFEPEIIASAALKLPDENQPVYLRIDAKGKYYDFHYGYNENDWILLKENADGTILSTEVAGGFVGTVIGMYAASEE